MKFNKKWLWLIIPLIMFSLVWINSSSVSTVLLAIKGTITDGNIVKFSGTAGLGEDAGVAASNVTKNKFNGTMAPTVNNDISEEYVPGSKWVDITNDKAYVCLDNSDGAAVWTEITSLGGVTSASNVGAQIEIFKQLTGVDLEFRTLKADSNKIIVTNEPTADITIGVIPADFLSGLGSITVVNMGGVASGSGIITSVEIWAEVNLSNCEVATFYVVSGNNLSTRDTEAIGTVTAGSKQTFSVSLDVVAGDHLGVYYTSGNLDQHQTVGSGLWNAGGDNIPCTDKTFGVWTNRKVSLYGTGISDYLDYIRFDIAEENIRLDDLKATEDNTDLNVSTSAHGLMPKLPDDASKFLGGTGSWTPLSEKTIGLLSATMVAFNADADTELYTVPTGKRCVLSHAIVVAADDAGATTTVSIGANGSETDFIPANTLSNLDAQYDSVILQPIPNTTPLKIKSYAAATVIEAQVATQSGVAGNTIYLFGILY